MESMGTIHKIGRTQTVGQNNFMKREVVILLGGEGENPKYPNYCAFEFVKDRCEKLDGFQVGQEVIIEWQLNGRLWNGPQGEKCFNTLRAWRINATGQQQPAQQQQQQQPQAGQVYTGQGGNPATPGPNDNFDIDGSDVPFAPNVI